MLVELKGQNMKLRMHNNSLRLRINPKDLDILDLEGQLVQSLKTNIQKWSYSLILDKTLKVQLGNEGFKFFIPFSDFELLKSDQVENINYEIDDFKLNIEKEYACLHPISKDSRTKSDSNFFPRPNKEGC